MIETSVTSAFCELCSIWYNIRRHCHLSEICLDYNSWPCHEL